jgi:hypothetical protein
MPVEEPSTASTTDMARTEQTPPLGVFVFKQIGVLGWRALGLCNVGSADGWGGVLGPGGPVSCC